MATITGLTAERMLEIEAQSIVDGEIIGNNLILERFDGTPIDAGVVVGPQGPQGNPGATGAGVPAGGTTGQLLKKNSATNYDTAWTNPPVVPISTTLPGSPVNEQQVILTDSLTAPTYQWLCQYDTAITDAHKWRVIGAVSISNSGQQNTATNGYTVVTSLAAPRAGVYRVEADITSNNGAVDSLPRAVVSGSVVRENNASSGQFSRSKTVTYKGTHTMAAGATVFVDSAANGSDATFSQGSVSLTPVRIS